MPANASSKHGRKSWTTHYSTQCPHLPQKCTFRAHISPVFQQINQPAKPHTHNNMKCAGLAAVTLLKSAGTQPEFSRNSSKYGCAESIRNHVIESPTQKRRGNVASRSPCSLPLLCKRALTVGNNLCTLHVQQFYSRKAFLVYYHNASQLDEAGLAKSFLPLRSPPSCIGRLERACLHCQTVGPSHGTSLFKTAPTLVTATHAQHLPTRCRCCRSVPFRSVRSPRP